jgi:hypothetical protein
LLDYLVVWLGVDQFANLGGLLNRCVSKQDTNLGEYRLKIIVSEQIAPSTDPTLQSVANDLIAPQRANWEGARRFGHGHAAGITCDSWRGTAGVLWTPNRLTPIEAPVADVTGSQWITGTLKFRKNMSGTHAGTGPQAPAPDHAAGLLSLDPAGTCARGQHRDDRLPARLVGEVRGNSLLTRRSLAATDAPECAAVGDRLRRN